MNVDPRKLYLIGRPKTAKEAWDKIRALFYKSSWNRRFVLRDRLASLRMNDGDDLEAHLEELIILLEAADAPVSQEERIYVRVVRVWCTRFPRILRKLH